MASKVLSVVMAPRHKRSKSGSFPEKNRLPEDGSHPSPDDSCRGNKLNKKPSPCTETLHSLKQEIMLLEKRLQDQFKVRYALEKALGYRSCQDNGNDHVSMPKLASELIKEIVTLELEVACLEQYLLTLYRKAFDHQVSSVSSCITDENPVTRLVTPRRRLLEIPMLDTVIAKKMEVSAVRSRQELASCLSEEEKSVDSGVQRCHSTLSQCSVVLAVRNSPPEDLSLKAVRACHSQPMSMLEYAQKSETSIVSLAEYLGTEISDHGPETPNKLSEDMVRCMSVIYCKLADSTPGHQGSPSLVSSSSSKSGFSPQDCRDPGSPSFRNGSSFETRLDNPFHVEELKEFSGPYNMMIEVSWIYTDSKKLGDIEPLLQKYRSFICRLEKVDLRRLKHEEKLAFWINVHNSLVMHAFLAYGIPQNNIRRTIQLLKAAYNVGGHTISADTIQGTILRCRMSRPGQWIRLILSPRQKYKNRDKLQACVVERSEPLLHFALCYGSHSDPAVRVYSPRNLSQELATAKEEYVRATFSLRKDKKILLPKVLESYAKDSGMCPSDIIEMVNKCLPDTVRRSRNRWPNGKASYHKSIEWMPYNVDFRTCESHPSNVCNFYCISCMGGAFCHKCKSKHGKCGRRNVLTAYKASGAATQRTEEMKMIWDISDICIYVINSKQIVFIQKKGGGSHTGSSHTDEQCWNCSYRIKPHVKYCLIECKPEDIMTKKGEANDDQACKRKSSKDANANANSAVEAEQGVESSAPKSYRKRPGKGIPHRAPFF